MDPCRRPSDSGPRSNSIEKITNDHKTVKKVRNSIMDMEVRKSTDDVVKSKSNESMASKEEDKENVREDLNNTIIPGRPLPMKKFTTKPEKKKEESDDDLGLIGYVPASRKKEPVEDKKDTVSTFANQQPEDKSKINVFNLDQPKDEPPMTDQTSGLGGLNLAARIEQEADKKPEKLSLDPTMFKPEISETMQIESPKRNPPIGENKQVGSGFSFDNNESFEEKKSPSPTKNTETKHKKSKKDKKNKESKKKKQVLNSIFNA